MSKELSPRQKAIMNNEKTYIGSPCKYGHIYKYTARAECIECKVQYMLKYVEANKAKLKAYQKTYQKEYKKKHKEQIKAYDKAYYQKHYAKKKP